MARKIVVAFAVAALFIAGGGVAQAGFATGLVSHWAFDGDLTDTVGGHNGTYVGDTLTTYAPGKFGAGVLLDGNVEHIQINDESAYDFGAAGNGMAISAWFRVDAFDTQWQALIAKGEGNEFRLHRHSSSATNMNWVAGGGGSLQSSGINVNDGQLHHIVVTHDGANSGARTEIWIDGVLRASANDKTQIGDNNEPLMIGENPDAQNREWEGLVDDVGIWGRPLTPTEIRTLWNNGDGKRLSVLIPEPTTLALLGLSIVGLIRRRKRA